MKPRGRLVVLVLLLAMSPLRSNGQGASSARVVEQENRERLAGLLRPQEPLAVQEAAVRRLAKSDTPSLPDILLDGWRGHTPRVRRVILDTLLTRESWTSALLDSLEDTCTPPEELETRDRRRLLDHPNRRIRARAVAIYSNRPKPEDSPIETCRLALRIKGNAAAGEIVFRERCAGCHRIAEVGSVVGPDLASLKNQTPVALMIAITDPNRSFDAGAVGYRLRTRNGSERTGLIVDETSKTLTFRTQGGNDEVLSRSAIDLLASTGQSLMPETEESDWRPETLADLVAFLATRRTVNSGE
ncbi:hypothetical protein ACYOEI_07795 [Singulisphaera rosea]